MAVTTRGVAQEVLAPVHTHDSPRLLQRFWSKVHICGPDDCWLWQRGKCKGYGRFGRGTVVTDAHRVAWELTYGPIPDGMFVLHQCEDRYPYQDHTSRACCNPAHLKLGTLHDNSLDAMKFDRMATGSRHWRQRVLKSP